MLFFYSFLMYLLTPFLWLRLWWKGRSLPAYRHRISERFFLNQPQTKDPIDIWVHAVSLGEVIAVIPLVEAMLQKKWTILITTMTPTGSERVQKHFGGRVMHQYVPYDLPGVLKRFFKYYQPHIGVIMETELWPNLIYQARSAKIPLLLANARLSDKSMQGYKKIKWLISPLLNQFQFIFTQAAEDAQRFITLGAPQKTISVLGNIKFDLPLNRTNEDSFQSLKNQWGEKRVVVIAASTHENEEEQILSQWSRMQAAIPGVILLIAPRHPERFQMVYQQCLRSGFNTGLRSFQQSLNPKNEIVILDSLGELLGMYSLSDYAFVGGSLVSVGGHNVLEPIAMNVPVISGDQVHNFRAICDALEKEDAMLLVSTAEDVINSIIKLHQNKELKQQLVKNAALFFEKNKGAVTRYMQQIEKLM